MSAAKPARSLESRAANQRSAARLAAVQALYQMDVGEASMEATIDEFVRYRLGQEVEGEQYLPADADYFRQIVQGTVAHQLDIDPEIDAALAVGWPLTRIDTTVRAVLRAGAFELGYRPDVPAKVVISEYVDVTRAFFPDEEPGVVNAVLDQIARKRRPGEFEARVRQ